MRIRKSSATAATSKRAQQPEPEINVTPLVDVVLVLLIIFIVIAPNLQEGTPVVLPEVRQPDEEKLEDAVEVVIDAGGKFYLDDKEIEKEPLFSSLRQARAAEPEIPIVLKADAGLPYGTVREAFVSLQQSGFVNVNLKVESKEET